MSEFWDTAKKTGIDVNLLRNALYDTTRTDKQEADPPRYELRDDVKRRAHQLLGPPPPGQDGHDPGR